MSIITSKDRYAVDKDILPIFIINGKKPFNIHSFCGTGFIISPNLFITCWHCVKGEIPLYHKYAAMIESNSGKFKVSYIYNIEQDQNGSDISISNIQHDPTLGLMISEKDSALGVDVWTFGYPLTDKFNDSDGRNEFVLNGRFLQGYITRAFIYESSIYGQVPSYELDMPVPDGLSGAPLIRSGSKEVIGVIYGNNDVDTIDKFSSVDPETGKREPEIVKIVSFGLAHYTDTLLNVKCKATKNQTLKEFLLKVKHEIG